MTGTATFSVDALLHVVIGVDEHGFFLAAAAAIAVVLGIVYVVASESTKFFSHVSVIEFLTSTTWTPLFDNPQYGIAPLLTGTFMSTIVALAVAVPLGLLVAIALANKMARAIWAMLTKQEDYRVPAAVIAV